MFKLDVLHVTIVVAVQTRKANLSADIATDATTFAKSLEFAHIADEDAATKYNNQYCLSSASAITREFVADQPFSS